MRVGDRVPNFSFFSHLGVLCHYADWRDKPLVLFFYPRDNTPGCTDEVCSFRDAWSTLAPFCHIVGVSRDSVSSHARFVEKNRLPFILLSDSDEFLCQLFDVIREKNLYGRRVRGIERSTFLIGTDATVFRVWRKVKISGHVCEVSSAVRELVESH